MDHSKTSKQDLYRKLSLPLITLGLLICSSGCQRDYVRPGELVEVRGAVYLDKHPVGEAHIVFVPEKVTLKSKFLISHGVTNAQGEFELTTSDNQEGALAGKHRVIISRANPKQTVTPLENLVAKITSEQNSQRSAVNEVWSILEKSIEQHDGELIPFYYNVHSELKCEIIPGIGIQELRFDLSSLDSKLKPSE